MLMGQMHGAASSGDTKLTPVNYTGTLAQLASPIKTYVIWHENMPDEFSLQKYKSLNVLRPNDSKTNLEMHMQFHNVTRESLLTAARATDAYRSYRPSTNMFMYAGWNAGIFAALALGLYGMHAAKVLHVNWKHMLFSASLASALAGIYCATRPDHVTSDDKENIIAVRTEKLPSAVYSLACGFYTANSEYRCQPIHDGYFNQVELGAPASADHRNDIKSSPFALPSGAADLPMRNLKDVHNAQLERHFNHVRDYLCNDLASDAKLGAILAVEDQQNTIPAYIPIATIATLAAGLVSGVGLARDYGLFTRVQG
jgi:hypothetical protein